MTAWLFLFSLLVSPSRSHAQIPVVVGGAATCVAEGTQSAITERCTSGAGGPRTAHFECAPMLVVELGAAPGLETVVGCDGPDDGSGMREGLVAIFSGGRLAWAIERTSIEGVRAEAMTLRYEDPWRAQLLLRTGSEDGSSLRVVAWTGASFTIVLQATIGGGMAEPDVRYDVSYTPGVTARIDVVRRPESGRPERTVWRWAPRTSAFSSAPR